MVLPGLTRFLSPVFSDLDGGGCPVGMPAGMPEGRPNRAYPRGVSDAVRILAPAKVNLALAVGPLGAAGMHPISSWMVTVDLCDELLVTRLPSDRLSRYAILWHEEAPRRSDIDWSITRDLAVRAHLALEAHVGRRLPVQLRMDKRIPVGGGLGGGSTDAAAMLRAVDHLFGLGLSLEDLEAIGRELGSDIPFLVRGGSAIVGGTGERLERHDRMADLHLVLAFPDAPSPTGPVYAAFDEQAPGPLREDAVRRLAGDGTAAPAPDALFNDLAPAALRLAPALGTLGAALSELADRPAHVTGSGATLFVVADDALHAEFLARAVVERLDTPALAVTAHAGPAPAPITDDADAAAGATRIDASDAVEPSP